jgi:hypothetical protein
MSCGPSLVEVVRLIPWRDDSVNAVEIGGTCATRNQGEHLLPLSVTRMDRVCARDTSGVEKRERNGCKTGYSDQKEGQPPRADLLASY